MQLFTKFFCSFSRLSIPPRICQQLTYFHVQAIECYLANINPTDDENISAFVLEELISQQVVQARMIGTNEQGVPMIHLYRAVNGQTTMVNRELVDRSCAQWLETTIVKLESPLEHPSIN